MLWSPCSWVYRWFPYWLKINQITSFSSPLHWCYWGHWPFVLKYSGQIFPIILWQSHNPANHCMLALVSEAEFLSDRRGWNICTGPAQNSFMAQTHTKKNGICTKWGLFWAGRRWNLQTKVSGLVHLELRATGFSTYLPVYPPLPLSNSHPGIDTTRCGVWGWVWRGRAAGLRAGPCWFRG